MVFILSNLSTHRVPITPKTEPLSCSPAQASSFNRHSQKALSQGSECMANILVLARQPPIRWLKSVFTSRVSMAPSSLVDGAAHGWKLLGR